MKLKKYCAGILLGGLLGLMALPSWAQDMRGQLNQALCTEDWESAIALVNGMMQAYPNNRTQLQQYRDRLQQLQASPNGLSAAQRAEYCSQAQPTPATGNLSDRLKQYYEQMDDLSYDETVALIGRSGQVRDRYFAYGWKEENGAALIAEFPGGELGSLITMAGMDCSGGSATDTSISVQCRSVPLPAKFERIEAGMREQAVLQQLGEPTGQSEVIEYEWQFQQGSTTCTLEAYAYNGQITRPWYYCDD